jgi:hypothetical protein
MKTLETPLISDRSTRRLSALGQKQLDRIIRKAAESNGTSRYDKNFRPYVNQVTKLVHSLIFDHNVTKEQLSAFQKSIKIVDNTLQLPSMTV